MFAIRRVLVIFVFLFLFGAKNVLASCTVSVTPSNVVMGTSSTSTFVVNNTGDQLINWVRIENPNAVGYAIAQLNATGWYGNGGGTRADFAGGYLEGGASANFELVLAETGETVSSVSWEALASYDAGDTFESCGSVSIQVDKHTPPVISNLSLVIGSETATLTWNTDLVAEGRLNYGSTSSYGSVSSTNPSTSHSVTLSGLLPSTTYHYQIQSTSQGGTSSTTNATFETGAAGVATTITNTVTNVVTKYGD